MNEEENTEPEEYLLGCVEEPKAWAEFSWPFGPSASPVRKTRASQGFCGPKGHESIAQALAWVRFSSDETPCRGGRK
jgi:hypothetical protein